MTGQELAVRQPAAPVHLSTDQIKFIANSNFVPKTYRGKLPEIMACIATGRELGLGDMESLRGINVIDGRPSLSAELMVKLVRRAGHSIEGEASAAKALVKGKRADTGDEITVTWTLEDAKRAGLEGKDNWRKYPRQMCWARAVSELCRMLFPDALSGAAYTREELEDAVHMAELSQATDVPFVPVETFDPDEDADPVASRKAPEPESGEESLFADMVPESARGADQG